MKIRRSFVSNSSSASFVVGAFTCDSQTADAVGSLKFQNAEISNIIEYICESFDWRFGSISEFDQETTEAVIDISGSPDDTIRINLVDAMAKGDTHLVVLTKINFDHYSSVEFYESDFTREQRKISNFCDLVPNAKFVYGVGMF